MSEKYVVVQGATCMCSFGNVPDTLVVKTQSKRFANDSEGTEKLIATTKETGSATLKNNSFGSCSKMGNPPPPCKVNITEWKDFYEKVTLEDNGGKILVAESTAVCAVAGTPCISITHHGQVEEGCVQNFKNVNPDILMQINPLADPREITEEESQNLKGENTQIMGT